MRRIGLAVVLAVSLLAALVGQRLGTTFV